MAVEGTLRREMPTGRCPTPATLLMMMLIRTHIITRVVPKLRARFGMRICTMIMHTHVTPDVASFITLPRTTKRSGVVTPTECAPRDG